MNSKGSEEPRGRLPKGDEDAGTAELHPFTVVGLGASAGGLEAFSMFLRALPADTGMAFVLVQHLDPGTPSALGEALRPATSMPIHVIEDGMLVEPDHVYVIPAGVDLSILRGRLVLVPPGHAPRHHVSIDFFFRALAADKGPAAFGVVLSGTATDGAEGLRAIKAANGITFAQDPATAKFDGMPRAAVASGIVDVVAPVPELVRELVRIAREQGRSPRKAAETDLSRVIVVLRDAVGVDFAGYKTSTLERRIARRMVLARTGTLPDYLAVLRHSPDEARALYEDLLIHVTSFFRDPEAYEVLASHAVPKILEHKEPGQPIRVWVPGCSTGEEVYSIAICLLEVLAEASEERRVQIFGTDMSEVVIEQARAGVYPASIVHDVSPERLERFFVKEEDHYRIAKHVREQCVFVRHDVVTSPPFSKLDMVSCRNVLIYFDAATQRRVVATFHFALNVPGFLWLGESETLTDPEHLFSTFHKRARIYVRSPKPTHLHTYAPRPSRMMATSQPPTPEGGARAPEGLVQRLERSLLSEYAPPGVIVNERMEILHFRGKTGAWLEPPAGLPRYDLLEMARKGLVADLRIALSAAKKGGQTVRRQGLEVVQNGHERTCDVAVVPLDAPGVEDRLFAVLFEERPHQETIAAVGDGRPRAEGGVGVEELERELEATKDYLQSIVEDHRKGNDELSTANEELISSNEELQSLNEELNTAKEELQSTNEELTTLNDELQSRNAQLDVVNADLVNVFAGIEIPIVILDADRQIRRFTPRASGLLNLRSTDIGRPLGEIRFNVDIDDLDAQLSEVIETAAIKESELQDREGRWFRLQVRPYVTPDRRIDGAVLSLVDIDALKQALRASEWARDFASSTVQAVPTPLLVVDETGRVRAANEAYFRSHGGSRTEVEGRDLGELAGGRWNVERVRRALAEVAADSGGRALRLESRSARGERRYFALSLHTMPSLSGRPLVLLAIDEVTDRVLRDEERLRLLHEAEDAKARAEQANQAKDTFLATLSHELRTPLSTLLLQAQSLRLGGTDETKLTRASGIIERAARSQAQLIDDLLDVSRIAAGKLRMERRPVALDTVVRDAVEATSPQATARSIEVEVSIETPEVMVSGDAGRLQQVVSNLLTNAIKFTPKQGHVRLTASGTDDEARLVVRDTGRGIAPELLPHVFERFYQVAEASTERPEGLGLGLAIVRHIVEGHGGTIEVESEGRDRGSTFTVTLPRVMVQSEGRAAADEGPNTTDRSVLSDVRILVVDDDVGTREALTQLLGAVGADPRSAGSAPEALALYDRWRPSLLVCDISMPNEDGYTLLKKIRSRGPEGGADVPAVALTALAGPEHQQRALAAGFQVHLAKPVEFDALVSVLARLVAPRATG